MTHPSEFLHKSPIRGDNRPAISVLSRQLSLFLLTCNLIDTQLFEFTRSVAARLHEIEWESRETVCSVDYVYE